MPSHKPLKCHACGASQFRTHPESGLLVCQYCGAQSKSTERPASVKRASTESQPVKRILTIVISSSLLILVIALRWYQHEQPGPQVPPPVINIQQPVLTQQAEVISNENKTVSESNTPKQWVNQHLTILHQVAGSTSSGGRYWLFEVQNSSTEPVFKPAITVSLFDAEGKRLAEQSGWSYRHQLDPGKNAHILVFIDQPPEDMATQEITTLAGSDGRYIASQQELTVVDYSVTQKNRQYEIIGDVKNEQSAGLSFPRVVAVARDAQGQIAGLGQAFTTLKNLPPHAASGFKIRLGTFLTTEPASWEVYGLGQ
jgi:hypothetical protein